MEVNSNSVKPSNKDSVSVDANQELIDLWKSNEKRNWDIYSREKFRVFWDMRVEGNTK